MRKFTPITPSLRHYISVNHRFTNTVRVFKRLTYFFKQHAGRGNKGRCCFFNRGSGNKFLYRTVNYKNMCIGVPCTILQLEYDPCRSAFIALVYYYNGVYSYILAPFQLYHGAILYSSSELVLSSINIGYTGILSNIPVGSLVYNVGILKHTGGILMRAAGSFGVLLRKERSYAVVRMRSGERRYVSILSYGTIGSVSNFEYRYIRFGKAGRLRWLGYRPTVRGVAMNPIDHPHGGDTSGGKVHSTPWSIPTKGKPTRRTKRSFIAPF